MNKKSFLKYIITFICTLSVIISGVFPMAFTGMPHVVMAESPTPEGYTQIEISTAEDLIALAENCHHEAWSLDKYVVLKNNISLSGTDFESIPIFSGYFNGNGYSVTGYSYGGTGYAGGFFRYIGKTGNVNSLTVVANIISGEDSYVTGILAGVNDGCVRKCKTSGLVSACTAIGGMVGINGENGLIIDCENEAQVSGFYYTGGIAGRNYGVIRRCSNTGNINSTPEWAAANDERDVDIISEITGDVSLISYQSGVDAGGIAGFSRGIIMNSKNEGIVGYERIGYNIGGISGRQSGMVYSCVNKGKVYGKKDVGGICGQQEPYIEVDKTKSVSDSIARINELVVKTANDAYGVTPALQGAVSDLQNASGKALDDAQSMTGDFDEYKIEGDRDWASMVEKQAENAGKAAADSVKSQYEELFDKYSNIPDGIDTGNITDQDVKDILSRLENGEELTEEEKARLDEEKKKAEEEKKKAEEETEAQKKEAEEKAEKERREAEHEFNDTINSGIDKWNSNIDTLSENADTISADLDNLQRAADNFVAVSNAYSTLLTNDIIAVNSSIDKTYDLVEDLINGTTEEGAKYLFSDVSELDISEMFNGRSVSCVNYGSVNGDINVGGTCGCMSVDTENLESNVIVKFDLKAGEGYAISNVITDCENSGLVEARTSCGGGICGRSEHGCIRECRGYGRAGSSDCNYVGGVAGYSEGSIVSSYALCTISGKDLVGGIAGYASAVKTSVSMPVFSDASGRKGGVAGQILRDSDTESINSSDFTGNHYVAGDFYGIDDISYDGIADEISYEDVLKIEGIPDDFASLKVTFVSDGEIIKIFHARYGDNVSDLVLPEIPDKDGSYGVWPDLTDVKVTGNLVIDAEYVSHVAVIKSESEYEQTGKPLALIQGEFKTGDTLKASVADEPFETPDSSAYTDKVMYEILFDGEDSLFNGEQEYPELRLYSPYDEYRLWVKNGDTWIESPFSAEGSYAQTQITSGNMVLCITKNPDKTLTYIGYAVIALIAVVVAVIMVRRMKAVASKIKKAEKKPEKS